MPDNLSDFWSTLWASGASPQCLSCGNTHWGDPTRVTVVPQLDATTGELEHDAELAAIAIVCGTCGFIRMHRLDLSVEEVETTEDGSNGAAG